MGIVRRRAEALGGSAAIRRRDDGPGTMVEAALPAQPASP
jgi:signal transduction histidine kinase